MNPNYPENDFIIKWGLLLSNHKSYVKNHTCVYHKDNLIIFGGYDNNKMNINHVFSYSIKDNKFSHCSCTGILPKPRNGHTATVIGSSMIMIGGWLGEESMASDEVYSLCLDTFNWERMNPHPSIGHANMHTADLYNDIIYIFRGGNGSAFLNDLIAYDIKHNSTEIVRLEGKIPSRRANHMSSIVKDYLFIFGGWSGHATLNDLYCINLLTKTSIEILANGIRPAFRAAARLVTNDNYLILFGGFKSNSIYLNDVHFFNYEKNYWFSSGRVIDSDKAPLPSAGHSMTLVNNRYVYIYGGGANSSYFNKMYLLEIDLQPEMPNKQSEASSIHFKDMFKCSFKNLFNNPYMSDVDILIEDKTIKAHKFILSLLSGKFHNMFSLCNIMKETSNINVTHFKHRHFEVFLKFLYSGELSGIDPDFDDISVIPKESNYEASLYSSFIYSDQRSLSTQIAIHAWSLFDYLELLRISDEYDVKELKIWCEKTVTSFLTCDNYSIIIAFAKKYNCGNLIMYLEWFYNENKGNIKVEEMTLIAYSTDKEMYDSK